MSNYADMRCQLLRPICRNHLNILAVNEQKEASQTQDDTAVLFMDFLRFSELSNLKCSDNVVQKTHLQISLEKSITQVHKQGHWLHLAKLNSEVCPVENNKKVFEVIQKSKMCEKHILRNTRAGQNLKSLDQPIRSADYATAREHIFHLLKNLGLHPKQFGFHSPGSRVPRAASKFETK